MPNIGETIQLSQLSNVQVGGSIPLSQLTGGTVSQPSNSVSHGGITLSTDPLSSVHIGGSNPITKQSFANSLPSAGAIAGGLIGGGIGAAAGGIGSIPGGTLGAAGGAAAGSQLKDMILGNDVDYGEAAKSGATAGALQLIGGGLANGLSMAAKAASPYVAPVIGKLTGYGSSLLETALKRSPSTIRAAKEGESVLNTEVSKTASNLVDYAKTVMKQSKETVAQLSKTSGGGKGYPGTRDAILEEGRKFVSQITDSLRGTYNIGVDKNGILNFNRSTLPSNIVSGSDGKTIQDAFNVVKSINKDTTISNIDAALERLMVLKSKTPAGTPTGGETRAIVNEMMQEVIGFTRSLGNISPDYVKYADFLDQNLPQRVFINEAKDIFGATKHISAEDTASLTKRMLATFSSGNSAIKGFAEKIGQTVGTDPVGAAAGAHVASDQFSVRAPNLVDRAIITKIAEALPRSLIKNYVTTGDILSLENHPLIASVAKLFGVTAQAAAQAVAQHLIEPTNSSPQTPQDPAQQ